MPLRFAPPAVPTEDTRILNARVGVVRPEIEVALIEVFRFRIGLDADI